MHYNPFSLENKRVLITGASSGIGRAIAIECSKLGAQVILTARSEERLHETLSMMEYKEKHSIIIADLSEKIGVDAILSSIDEKLDGIVSCAGYTTTSPISFIKSIEFSGIMQVNFESPFYLIQSLLKNKRINKKASIVFISSISGVYISMAGNAMYASSKAALDAMAKSMAIEFAPKNIRVNCVNPGMVNTHIMDKGIINKEQLNEDMKKYPLKRYGEPEEIAYAVVYLLSDASSWTTVANLVIDGGYTLL